MPGRAKRDGAGDNNDPAHHDEAEGLALALLQPRDSAEMRALLADICTPGEIRSLAERWRVAQLLQEGALSYREIHDATGVSTTTITRVARFLRDEPHGGYRLALDRMRKQKNGTRKPAP